MGGGVMLMCSIGLDLPLCGITLKNPALSFSLV